MSAIARRPHLRLLPGGARNTIHSRYAQAFPARAEAAATIRHDLADIARACGLSDRAVADVELVVSEAVSNVVLHAYPDGGGEVRVEAYWQRDELLIIVSDDGHGMKPRTDSPGCGLGLGLIAALCSRTEILSEGLGTEIHMVFACPAFTPAVA
ncbi:MAG: ATP-binding protein [Solirubrobacteraceae bacterium]|nr:ATP-binding protein [Solirubrobacteraceae bacterium]